MNCETNPRKLVIRRYLIGFRFAFYYVILRNVFNNFKILMLCTLGAHKTYAKTRVKLTWCQRPLRDASQLLRKKIIITVGSGARKGFKLVSVSIICAHVLIYTYTTINGLGLIVVYNLSRSRRLQLVSGPLARAR